MPVIVGNREPLAYFCPDLDGTSEPKASLSLHSGGASFIEKVVRAALRHRQDIAGEDASRSTASDVKCKMLTIKRVTIDPENRSAKESDHIFRCFGELTSLSLTTARLNVGFSQPLPSFDQSAPSPGVHLSYYTPGDPEPVPPVNVDSLQYYIQCGSPHLVNPTGGIIDFLSRTTSLQAAIFVTSINQEALSYRVRKSGSYESTIVDILRILRGIGRDPSGGCNLFRLVGGGQTKFPIYIVYRLSSGAILSYRWGSEAPNTLTGPQIPNNRESATLHFREDRPAAKETPWRGRMHGYTAGLAGTIAASCFERYALIAKNDTREQNQSLDQRLAACLKQGLCWQAAYFNTGYGPLLIQPSNDNSTTPSLRETNWLQSVTDEAALLLNGTESHDGTTPRQPLGTNKVNVPIPQAVAHRHFWYISESYLDDKAQSSTVSPAKSFASEYLPRVLHRWAFNYLTQKYSPATALSALKFHDLHLVDRGEIEDYLGLYNALCHYGDTNELKPLNIAVFGPPGAGKSFGITELATDLASSVESFGKQVLVFNVGQFTGLTDLTRALHQVRNECLGGRIPIVFFDEFDATFEGRPFGWLKYFLAPMQDAKFADQGITYNLGRCVLVFAGGINRSFEELNGRLRNQSFCDAKGTDFISRLKLHLNVRGVNKPDDEDDRDRYLLRRAILLYNKLKPRIYGKGENTNGLLQDKVALAFIGTKRFKHGARSMEAIINMCNYLPGRPIGASDLPPKAQLEMHVDAAEFLGLVRSSSNASP